MYYIYIYIHTNLGKWAQPLGDLTFKGHFLYQFSKTCRETIYKGHFYIFSSKDISTFSPSK